MNTNGEGVAVCSCGGELHIACANGCAEPDAVFRTRATDRHIRSNGASLGHCNYRKCTEPVAPRTQAKGRPPTKCVKHREQGRRWSANHAAAKAAKPAVEIQQFAHYRDGQFLGLIDALSTTSEGSIDPAKWNA